MNTVAANQGRVFLQLFDELEPHLRTDRNLPARIQQRLAREKRFGSRDRRLYRELLYTAVRFLPWVEQCGARSETESLHAVIALAADLPATRDLKAALPSQWAALPPTIAEKSQALGVDAPLLPPWFRSHCEAAFDEPNLSVLHSRAPLWLRLQTEDGQAVLNELTARGWAWRRSEMLPAAVEVLSEADVTQTDGFKRGLVEIQDIGSQSIVESIGVRPGERWLDVCAGAGGKTLQLAFSLGGSGRVDATDPRPSALDELHERAHRARIANISTLRSAPTVGAYDGVLVDAPCSGSGTWRRAPHLKWTTSEADLRSAADLQLEILNRASPCVRPGGVLVYATCSLSVKENDQVVASFLEANPAFSVVRPERLLKGVETAAGGLLWLPAANNSDGYFVAKLRRT